MRALVISHACVLPANQVLLGAMEALPDVEVALIAPARWWASVGGLREFARFEGFTGPVIPKPVWMRGRVNAHFYRSLGRRDLPWRPDVVFADEEAFSLAAYQGLRLARGLGIPLVFKSNQSIVRQYPPPFAWTEKAMHRHAAGTIACTKASLVALREKGYAGPAEVIGFGLDPEVTRPYEVLHLRGQYGMPDEAFVIGFMGRFSPQKGALDVVEACHVLERTLPAGQAEGCYLLVIGEGEQQEELEARARELQRIKPLFPGLVPYGRGAAEHFSLMDVCVVPSRTTPSWKEQFGRVITEAMGAGTPVLGSDSGNVPGLVEESGGGRVFPEGDAEALAGAIREFLEDRELGPRLGAHGREHVVREYSYRRIAERTVEVLREAVARGAP